MRKVSMKAAQALLQMEDGRQSANTHLRSFSDEGTLYLHGYPIAIYYYGNHANTPDQLHLSDCGWQTATTKERLNAVLATFGLPYSIYQKNYTWYLSTPNGDVPWTGRAAFCLQTRRKIA